MESNMWKVNQVPGGWEVRHENGKQGTTIVFKLEYTANEEAKRYNSIPLGFCPDCGITQMKSWTCRTCADKILEKKGPDILKNRKTRCLCGREVESVIAGTEQSYAFFEYRPDMETDSFYCGCRGWD